MAKRLSGRTVIGRDGSDKTAQLNLNGSRGLFEKAQLDASAGAVGSGAVRTLVKWTARSGVCGGQSELLALRQDELGGTGASALLEDVKAARAAAREITRQQSWHGLRFGYSTAGAGGQISKGTILRLLQKDWAAIW